MVASIDKTEEGSIGFDALKGADVGITNGWIKKYDTVLAPFLMFIVYTSSLLSPLHMFSVLLMVVEYDECDYCDKVPKVTYYLVMMDLDICTSCSIHCTTVSVCLNTNCDSLLSRQLNTNTERRN